MSEAPPILEFVDAVPPESDAGARSALRFALRPGEWAMIETSDHLAGRLIADLALGLIEPVSGAVRFLGRTWDSIPHDEACALRGLDTGRVFSGEGWVGNLDMDENMTLAIRHHESRPESALRAAARDIARRLGLPDIPDGRPAWISPRRLRMAQWARALQRPRRLLVLEFPTEDTEVPDSARLAAELRAAARGGAALLWIGPDSAMLDDGWSPVARIHTGPDPASAADTPPDRKR